MKFMKEVGYFIITCDISMPHNKSNVKSYQTFSACKYLIYNLCSSIFLNYPTLFILCETAQ